MQKNIDLYFDRQDDNSKLIYTIGLLWGQISTTLDSLLANYGLNISKFNILMIIKHVGQENGIQQNEISKRLLVTASNITKLLDKLEKDGMITRNDKKTDRRVKLIKVTDSTSKLLDKVWPVYLEEINKLVSSLKETDRKNVEKLLLNWLDVMNA